MADSLTVGRGWRKAGHDTRLTGDLWNLLQHGFPARGLLTGKKPVL